MKQGIYKMIADEGKHFILTELGYEVTPERVRCERKVGEPVRLFEFEVPRPWVEKGYVVECELSPA